MFFLFTLKIIVFFLFTLKIIAGLPSLTRHSPHILTKVHTAVRWYSRFLLILRQIRNRNHRSNRNMLITAFKNDNCAMMRNYKTIFGLKSCGASIQEGYLHRVFVSVLTRSNLKVRNRTHMVLLKKLQELRKTLNHLNIWSFPF